MSGLFNLKLLQFAFFIFKLSIMSVHTSKMCTFYFVHISCFFHFCGLEQQLPFLYFQTLHNDCSLIEDVHLSFCAPLINIFFILDGC